MKTGDRTLGNKIRLFVIIPYEMLINNNRARQELYLFLFLEKTGPSTSRKHLFVTEYDLKNHHQAHKHYKDTQSGKPIKHIWKGTL